MVEGNGKTPTAAEVHRRQDRMDGQLHDNSRRINDLEQRYARIETKVDGLIQTVNKHSDESDKGMKSLDSKVDHIIQSFPEKNSARFEQMWGAARIVGFILVLIATSSTAVVMLL